MKKRKMTDDGPALRALRALEYRPAGQIILNGINSGFLVRNPQGQETRLKIQKSGPPTGEYGRSRHRHRYGLAYTEFGCLDELVLWANNENVFFIIPTSFLTEVLKMPGERPKILTRSPQWETHVYFDDYLLKPTGYDAAISIEEYAHAIIC